MKNYRKELNVITEHTEEFFNLSFEVEECLRESGITDGICVVMSHHCTSSVFLEKDTEELSHDWSRVLMKLAPEESDYKVDYFSAGGAHIKAMLMGASVTVPVSDGRLDLGPRQYIMYGDFDGCREKTVIVKIIGE